MLPWGEGDPGEDREGWEGVSRVGRWVQNLDGQRQRCRQWWEERGSRSHPDPGERMGREQGTCG